VTHPGTRQQLADGERIAQHHDAIGNRVHLMRRTITQNTHPTSHSSDEFIKHDDTWQYASKHESVK